MIKSTRYPPKYQAGSQVQDPVRSNLLKNSLVARSDLSVGEEELLSFELEVCDILLGL